MVTYITPSSLVLELIRLIWKWGALCHDSVGWGVLRVFPGLFLLKMCWKQIFRIIWLHGICYTGLWTSLFNQQKKSLMLDTFSTLKRLIRSKWSQYWDWRIMTLKYEMFYLLHLRQRQDVLFWKVLAETFDDIAFGHWATVIVFKRHRWKREKNILSNA